MLEYIDGELCLLDDQSGVVIHVFEKGSFSRAAYKHMCAWVQANFEKESSVDELWVRAEEAWDSMTPEQQMTIWTLTLQEEQNARDVSQGLLATLDGYQCVSSVRAMFQNAIRKVLDIYT